MAEAETVINPLHPSVADKLDPEYAAVYMQYQSIRQRADQVPYEIYNLDRPKYTFPTYLVAGPTPDVGDATIYQAPVTEPAGEIPIEVFTPTADAIAKGGLAHPETGRLPAYIDFHGGGFVIGSLKDDQSLCRQMCQGLGCVVVNVDYRTAPEFPHPTSAIDAWEATKWVVANAEKLNIDASRIAVGGLSAGGCLAAVVSLLARDDPTMPPLKLQVLIVPVLDVRYVPKEGGCEPGSVPYESYVSYEFAPMLPLARLVWFYNLWLGTGVDDEGRKARAEDFRASPMVAASHANLAPASFHVAGIDPLRSEAEAYHAKLVAAGTKSTFHVYEGCGHTVPHWDGRVEKSKQFIRDMMAALKESFQL